MGALPHLVLTSGEPAGIGPDLLIQIAQERWPFRLTVLADPELLRERAALLGLPLELLEGEAQGPHEPGRLSLLEIRAARPVAPGRPDPENAPYVVAQIEQAARGCLEGRFDAMVTAPVHKGVIHRSGIFFTGHTEFIASLTGGAPLMLLFAETAQGPLRVALATTHLPLKVVHRAITASLIVEKVRTLALGLERHFGIQDPRIAVLGLNPHAGEGGSLGREELEEISPAVQVLREEGIRVSGPLSADTAFIPERLRSFDAYLAMFHDQGLPVLKALGFGRAVNVTLGLPILRTSVDHGTALELAGTGRADPGSLKLALRVAAEMVQRGGESRQKEE